MSILKEILKETEIFHQMDLENFNFDEETPELFNSDNKKTEDQIL